jgi:transposase
LTHSLRGIFSNKNATKESARASLVEWYGKVAKVKNEDFNVLAETLQQREDEVLNFFLYRSTNAQAEVLNTKIKAFRAQLRGIVDLKFFLFRLTRIYT